MTRVRFYTTGPENDGCAHEKNQRGCDTECSSEPQRHLLYPFDPLDSARTLTALSGRAPTR